MYLGIDEAWGTLARHILQTPHTENKGHPVLWDEEPETAYSRTKWKKRACLCSAVNHWGKRRKKRFRSCSFIQWIRKEGGGGKCSISDAPKQQLPCVCSGIYLWPRLWRVRWVKLDLPHWKSSATAESSPKKKSDIPATLKTEKAELWLSGHLFPEVGVWKAVARFLKSSNSTSKFTRWLLGLSSKVWAHKTVLFCLGLKKQQHMDTHFSYCVKWIVRCQFCDHGLPGIEMSLFRQNLTS